MFDAKDHFRSLFVLDPLVLGAKLLLLIGIFALWPVRIYATTRNVTATQYAGGAKGDGTTDDTAAINSAIAALQPGDTLLFPCTGSNTYLISSQLSISVTDVIVDGSSCATIKDTHTNSGLPSEESWLLAGTVLVFTPLMEQLCH